MKLIITFLIVLLISLLSCEKSSTYCWKCNSQNYVNYAFNGMPIEDTTMCNVAKDYVYRYELNHTHSDGHGTGIKLTCKIITVE